MQKKVVHLINGLGKGGAETMLYQILKYRSDSRIQYQVISLGGEGHYYEELIKQLGIDVVAVSLRKKPFSSLLKISRALKGADVLCCWMYHANLIGYYLGRMFGIERIVWNIRHSNLDSSVNSKLTMKVNKWCAKRSKNVSQIAYNGEQARKVHEEIGYSPDHVAVVDNGCDCEEFRPDTTARQSLLKEFGIQTDYQIVLSVAKNHPIKDIPTFIKAFAKLHQELPHTVALMCGKGIDNDNLEIITLCNEKNLQIGKDIYLVGMRYDVPRLMAGCDLYVLHSAGEAFPNTLIQAMASGCLCVATDVGDARRIVSDDLAICEPQNVLSLYKAMQQMVTLPSSLKNTIGSKNRERVVQQFSIQSAVKSYERIY